MSAYDKHISKVKRYVSDDKLAESLLTALGALQNSEATKSTDEIEAYLLTARPTLDEIAPSTLEDAGKVANEAFEFAIASLDDEQDRLDELEGRAGDDEDATPSTTRKTSPAKAKKGRECLCGCGGTTRGGRFLPGHDARHKGNLLRTVRANDTNKKVLGAGDELHALGWAKFMNDEDQAIYKTAIKETE